MKKHLLLALPLALALAPACAVDTDDAVDELAAEDADTLEGKNDGPNGASTYFSLVSDASGISVYVSRLNRSTTRCVDTTDPESASRCYAATLDWSETDFSEVEIGELEAAKPTDDVISRGQSHWIVRGRLASRWVDLGGENGRVSTFVVSEVWRSSSDDVGEGVFVKVHDRGGTCAAPCEGLTERKLNSAITASIANVELAGLGLTPLHVTQIEQNDLADQGRGLIVAGLRTTRQQGGVRLRQRSALAAYQRVLPGELGTE